MIGWNKRSCHYKALLAAQPTTNKVGNGKKDWKEGYRIRIGIYLILNLSLVFVWLKEYLWNDNSKKLCLFVKEEFWLDEHL